jgi:hypothetical protein
MFICFNNNELIHSKNQHILSKCNICDDDIVEDLHHFLFECKTLRGIRQELFEEIETVINEFIVVKPNKHIRPGERHLSELTGQKSEIKRT